MNKKLNSGFMEMSNKLDSIMEALQGNAGAKEWMPPIAHCFHHAPSSWSLLDGFLNRWAYSSLYYFVKFQDGSNDIVHSSWMMGDDFCRWPPGDNTRSIASLVKSGNKPSNDWGMYKVTVSGTSGKLVVSIAFFWTKLFWWAFLLVFLCRWVWRTCQKVILRGLLFGSITVREWTKLFVPEPW